MMETILDQDYAFYWEYSNELIKGESILQTVSFNLTSPD